MHNLKLSITLSAFAVAAQCATAQPPDHFDFKGVPLEISYDEFRQLPHPDGTEGAKVLCTGETVPLTSTYSSEPSEVRIHDETQKDLGVKKCVWVSGAPDPKRYRRAGEVLPLKLASSGYVAYDYSFSFLPDPADGVLRLYRVQCQSNHNATVDVLQALAQKWGTPVTTSETVQNRMGATFVQIKAIWSNASGSILVQDRWLKIDKMMILMESHRLAGIVAEAEKTRKAEAPNPI